MSEFKALADQASDESEKSLAVLYQANCLWHLNRFKEARELWSQATTISTSPFSELLDASLCIAEGRSEEALRKLTTFLRDHTELNVPGEYNAYADAQDELGRLLFDLGRYEEAVNPLEGALLSAKPDKGKRICFYLGVCHYKNERWDSAEEKFLRSLPPDCTDPCWVQAQYHLGYLYFQKSEYSKAKASFEMCQCFMNQSDTDFKANVLKWLSRMPL